MRPDKKTLIIMQGCSGSGKSTIAQLLREVTDGTVCSADDCMMEKGVYKFRPEKLAAAHETCREAVRLRMKYCEHVIIVDNTNTRAWEMEPYAEMAKMYGYTVRVLTVTAPLTECANNNVHNVPPFIVQAQRDRINLSDVKKMLDYVDFEDTI